MYVKTFYGRHTAQHQLQWIQIKIRNEILQVEYLLKYLPYLHVSASVIQIG